MCDGTDIHARFAAKVACRPRLRGPLRRVVRLPGAEVLVLIRRVRARGSCVSGGEMGRRE